MFRGRLVLASDPIPDHWVVVESLVWEDARYGHIEVPRGFRTDLASYPRVLRNLPCFDIAGPSRRPAVVHDWLYASRRGAYDKALADDFLHDALQAEGVGRCCAMVTYLGVHWCGGPSWRSDAGVLDSRGFDTPEDYRAWKASAVPRYSHFP